MRNVIEPLTKEELEQIFDTHSIEVMNFFLKELMLTKPEVLPGQRDIPIYAPQEYVEQWFVQALGAKPVGAGSYPIDIIKDNEYGADIKSLSYKVDNNGNMLNRMTGEASLGQKFNTDTDEFTLDQLFSLKRRNDILDLWIDILNKKYNSIKKDTLIDYPLYFFFILRGASDFYLVGSKVFPDNVQLLTVDDKRSTQDSVFVEGYIDPNYGNCKIYKAKKRMELRLYPKYWIEQNKYMKFIIPRDRVEQDLRDLSIRGELDNYLINKLTIIEN